MSKNTPGEVVMRYTVDVDITPKFTYKLWDKYGDISDKCQAISIIHAINRFYNRGSCGVKITKVGNPDFVHQLDGYLYQ